MQPEESIEIKHRFARNVDARPHGVILRFAIRHHDVQAVGCAALEDHDQALIAHARLSTYGGASEKTRHRRRADDGERAVTKKDATTNCHKVSVET